MPRAKRITALALVVLAATSAGVLAACGSGGEEAKLTVYTSREAEYIEPLTERFERQTGIELDVRYGDAAELAATIIEEGDNTPADVFWAQDAGVLGTLDRKGMFDRLPSDVLDRVPARFRAANGDWVGTSGRSRVVAYSTKSLQRSDLPDSILDFTDPKWKGKIGWTPTNGSFQAFVTALRLSEGERTAAEWLRGIVANEPQAFESNEAVRDAIANGEVEVGFINHYYVVKAKDEYGKDYPVAMYVPPGGDAGALVNAAGVGKLMGSENPDSLRFIRFLLSDPSQRYFADALEEYPLVPGVEADPRLTPLDEIVQPDVTLAELWDLDGTLKLLKETGAL